MNIKIILKYISLICLAALLLPAVIGCTPDKPADTTADETETNGVTATETDAETEAE